MNKRGLFIGLTTIDIQFFTNNFPTPNQKIKTEMPFISAGGPAANAAITFSFLGGSADFFTCIGKHQFSELLRNDLDFYDFKVFDAISDLEADPIISAIITTTSNSERTIFTHHPQRINSVLKWQNDLDQYDFIFTDGFYPELAVDICTIAKQKGIPVILDGGSWKEHLLDLLPFVDIAICSENFIPPECNSITEIFDFLSAFHISEMAISRGGESIVTLSDIVDIENVNAVDSLGAGDVLHGAFCFFWSESKQFTSSLERASKIASYSTKFKGTRNWMNYFKKRPSI